MRKCTRGYVCEKKKAEEQAKDEKRKKGAKILLVVQREKDEKKAERDVSVEAGCDGGGGLPKSFADPP